MNKGIEAANEVPPQATTQIRLTPIGQAFLFVERHKTQYFGLSPLPAALPHQVIGNLVISIRIIFCRLLRRPLHPYYE